MGCKEIYTLHCYFFFFKFPRKKLLPFSGRITITVEIYLGKCARCNVSTGGFRASAGRKTSVRYTYASRARLFGERDFEFLGTEADDKHKKNPSSPSSPSSSTRGRWSRVPTTRSSDYNNKAYLGDNVLSRRWWKYVAAAYSARYGQTGPRRWVTRAHTRTDGRVGRRPRRRRLQ